jgi:hypothetical protein
MSERQNKNKDIRDIHILTNLFKEGYELRTNLMKPEKGLLLVDSYNLNR